MEDIKNIVVCLDLTEIDPPLINYAAFISDTFRAQYVYFVHVIQAYDLPKKSSRSFPDVQTSLQTMLQKEIDRRIDAHFRQDHHAEIVIKVAEQDAAEQIVQCASELSADLLLMGQKHGEDRQGRYGKKVASSVPCDVLFVPEDASLSIQKVLCALDFSKDSEKAFGRALYMGRHQQASVICYFIHDTSKAYFPASTQKSAERSQSRAEKRYREFIDGFSLDPGNFPCLIEPADERTNEGERLYHAAEDRGADLIIVGAAGSTETETSLLGNISETLRRIQTNIPVLIVKNAGGEKFFAKLFKQ